MNGEKLLGSFVTEDKIYTTWHVSEARKEFMMDYFEKPYDSFRKALRIYDVTHLSFNGNNAHKMHEFLIRDNQNHLTIKGLKNNRNYCLELGVLLSETEFFPLIRSDGFHASGMSEKLKQTGGELVQENQALPSWNEQVSTYSFYETAVRKGD